MWNSFLLLKSLRPFLLSLLFAVLAAGGNTTFCSVLSVIGLKAHHHAVVDGVASDLSAPCTGDHGNERHDGEDHRRDEVPCPESCELRLDVATTAISLKIPVLVESFAASLSAKAILPIHRPIGDDHLRLCPDLPPGMGSLCTPPFTGCFLI